MSQPIVAVSTDTRHFENYTWHAAPQQYLEAAITGADVIPLLVPSFGDRLDLDAVLDRVDGVLLTGSKSNVDPALYGGDASEANGPYDTARDSTTLPMIRSTCCPLGERRVPAEATSSCTVLATWSTSDPYYATRCRRRTHCACCSTSEPSIPKGCTRR